MNDDSEDKRPIDDDSVAAKWQRLVESDDSVYRRNIVPAQRVRTMARSGYVEPVIAHTADGDPVLEAGCGSGTISLALASRGRAVVSLDISPQVLQNLAHNRALLAEEMQMPLKLDTVRGDLERLPFPDGAFAAATNEGVVEHWIDRTARRRVIAEMARVVRPGGVVAIYVPNGKHPLIRWWELTRYPGFVKSAGVPWHKYGWRDLGEDLAAAGLTEVQVDGLSPYSTLAVWPNWLILRGFAALLRRLLPEPLWLRRRWGFNLMAIGLVGAKSAQ